MPTTPSRDVPTRPLGRTGEQVSIVGLGGWHLGLPHVSEALAVRLVHEALDRGITFLDNCWDYNEGASEERMGRALAGGRRQRAYLMTKIDGRTATEATRQLEESLRRLRTDCIDLVQHHEMLRFEDADRIFREDGAHAALERAREQGKLRHVGFTGHKDPRIHLHVLERADAAGIAFDAVQMPLNVMDAHFRSFERLVLPELVQRGVGVLGMKSMANGRILESMLATPEECLRYALSLPTTVVITGCDTAEILAQAVGVARDFRSMEAAERELLLARTAEAAMTGEWELFKTTAIYDGTAEHPEWLGEEPARYTATKQA